MAAYIMEDFRRALKSRLSAAYMIGILALCILANAAVIGFRIFYGSHEGTFAYNIIEYATWCFVIPYYTCIVIADIAFGRGRPDPKDYRKNGKKELNRTQLYLEKLLTAVLISVVYVVFASVALIVLTVLFHFTDGTIRAYNVADFYIKLVCAIPLWLAGIGMGNMFLFLIRDKRKAYLAYLGLTVLVERGVMLFAAEPFKLDLFRLLRTITVTQQFSLIPYPADPSRNIPLTVFLGFLYLILSTLIGIILYRREDREV